MITSCVQMSQPASKHRSFFDPGARARAPPVHEGPTEVEHFDTCVLVDFLSDFTADTILLSPHLSFGKVGRWVVATPARNAVRIPAESTDPATTEPGTCPCYVEVPTHTHTHTHLPPHCTMSSSTARSIQCVTCALTALSGAGSKSKPSEGRKG